jgi:hypothetical protein
MENIKFILDTYGNEHAIIDRGNGEYTSMPKSTYEAMRDNYLTAYATMKSTQSDEADLTEGTN